MLERVDAHYQRLENNYHGDFFFPLVTPFFRVVCLLSLWISENKICYWLMRTFFFYSMS